LINCPSGVAVATMAGDTVLIILGLDIELGDLMVSKITTEVTVNS